MKIDFSAAMAENKLKIDAPDIGSTPAVSAAGVSLHLHPNLQRESLVRLEDLSPTPNLIVSAVVTNPRREASPVRFSLRALDARRAEVGSATVVIDGGQSGSMFILVLNVHRFVSLELGTRMADPKASVSFAWARFDSVTFGSFDEKIMRLDLNQPAEISVQEVQCVPASWAPPELRLSYMTIAESQKYHLSWVTCPNRKVLQSLASETLEWYEKGGITDANGINCFALENVTVIPHGVVIAKGRMIQDTVRYLPKSYREFAVEVWRKLVSDRQTRQRENVEGKTLLLVEQPTASNYGHWLVEIFPKIIPFAGSIRSGDVSICLSTEWEESSIIAQTLQIIGLSSKRHVTWVSNIPTEVERALFVSPISRHPHPGYIAPWVGEVLNNVTSQVTAGEEKRIFVSRQDASSRRLTNEDEAFSVVASHGFKRLCTGDMPFVDQVAAFRGADYVIGVFGASLSNIVFCRPGAKILLLCPNSFFDHFYLDLSSIRGLVYWHFVGVPVQHDRLPLHADFEVDISDFKRTADEFLSLNA